MRYYVKDRVKVQNLNERKVALLLQSFGRWWNTLMSSTSTVYKYGGVASCPALSIADNRVTEHQVEETRPSLANIEVVESV
jgi:hypothetical protein